MFDAKFVLLAFGAGVIIGIRLGKSGDEAIEVFGAFVVVGVALSLAVSGLDRFIEWRRWRRFLRRTERRREDSGI
jgi:hypothetical protein